MDQQQNVDNWEYRFLTAGVSKQKAMKAILDRQKEDLKQSDQEIDAMNDEIAKIQIKIQNLQEEDGPNLKAIKR